MDNDVAITLEHVSKKYCKNIKDSMVYGMTDIGRNLVGLKSCSDQLRKNEFWAVNDVSFEVNRGETLGIIGPNGSGKTTILKMLNGIFWPDKGKITVAGKVGALIAVGAGFHPQLSGRENIYINGAILGMNKKEIDKKFDAIVDFADIGDFLDAPVKHYSSGMYVRLGFAIAAYSDSDILLIDEILSVGDIAFQAKCTKKMKELDKKGVTKIFISHNLNSVQLLCDKTIYIKNGVVKYAGNTVDVINDFKKDSLLNKAGNANDVRYGTKEIEITKVEIFDQDNVNKSVFKRGQPFRVKVIFNAKEQIKKPEFSISIFTSDGVELSNATTRDHSIQINEVNGIGEIVYSIKSLPFNIGKYWVTIGCWDETGLIAYDHLDKMYEIIIENGMIDGCIGERFGLVHIPAQWDVTKILSRPNESRI